MLFIWRVACFIASYQLVLVCVTNPRVYIVVHVFSICPVALVAAAWSSDCAPVVIVMTTDCSGALLDALCVLSIIHVLPVVCRFTLLYRCYRLFKSATWSLSSTPCTSTSCWRTTTRARGAVVRRNPSSTRRPRLRCKVGAHLWLDGSIKCKSSALVMAIAGW